LAKKTTLNNRIDFSSIEKVLEYPDFLDIQLQSFKDFLQIETPAEKRQNEGLCIKYLQENFPISDSRENFVLEFVDYTHRPTKLYSARVIPFKGSWIEFATDINSVMYAYIDRKKKLPVTTLFRAIGFERDKDILEIFDLAEEIKVSKTGLKKYIGRKLAARVLNTWHEDFVDEDTGEVVSIERNEIILIEIPF
jgi:DNA-directed RNA polymerase beta subunit